MQGLGEGRLWAGSILERVQVRVCLCCCSVRSLRAKQVLANLKTYTTCREEWRKKVEQNGLRPTGAKELLRCKY